MSAKSTSSKELRSAKARRAGSIGHLRQDGKGELKAHDHDGFNSPMAVIDARTLPRLRRIRQRPPPPMPLTPRARSLSLALRPDLGRAIGTLHPMMLPRDTAIARTVSLFPASVSMSCTIKARFPAGGGKVPKIPCCFLAGRAGMQRMRSILTPPKDWAPPYRQSHRSTTLVTGPHAVAKMVCYSGGKSLS